MKKILVSLLTIFSLSAFAKENITIIYGFNAADNAANYSRALADEANKIQNKYNFMFDVKPGAGQVVAYNYVKDRSDTIFMTSGAYWLRPVVYPTQSYEPREFRSIMTMCSAPFSVGSFKYKSWSEVPKDRPITVATSGLGVLTHATSVELQKVYPNLTIVPFKGVADAVIAAMGGQTDFAVAFLGDMEKYQNLPDGKPSINILGVTGPKPVHGVPNLASQGFPSLLSKMNTPYTLMVPKSWSDAKAHEVREILAKVESKKSVRDAYALDYCAPFNIQEKALAEWWEEQNTLWTRIGSQLKVDQ